MDREKAVYGVGKARKMEVTVPWWRKVIDFALGGFRTGLGLFRRNGRVDASASSEAEVAVERAEIGAEDVAAVEIDRAEMSAERSVEVAIEETRIDAVGGGEGEVESIEIAAVSGSEDEIIPSEFDAREEEAELARSSPHSEAVAAEAKKAAEAVPGAEEELVPEEPVAGSATKDEAATLPAEVSAPEAAAGVGETAAVEEKATPQEVARTLPLALEPVAEKTTAEKVAAALKARGEDAEQSPFSVIVGQVYDGPLDLLLDLIRKQDIDIYDIPIAKITAQFLAYVDRLKASDMDVAGDFIYTAALLIHIKSKMLLPRAPAGPEEAEDDPRRELVERLLEHERFKNAAQMLHEKQMLEAATWTNPGVREFKEDAGAEPEIAADTTDLVRVFSDILERARNRPIINVEEDTVTVSQMIQFLTRRLTMEDKPVALRRLLSHTRSERALIAMFLALLELVRLQAILLRQDRHFSEIFIKKHAGFDAAMNQGLADARDDWR